MRCSVNLVVFECGAVQHADKVCGRSAACGCIFCYPHHLYCRAGNTKQLWLASRSRSALTISAKAIGQKTTLTQEQGTHRSQPTRTQPNRKCKAKKTQFEPESDSAIGQHLLESNQCARNYSDSRFKILTRGGVLEDTFWSPWPRSL